MKRLILLIVLSTLTFNVNGGFFSFIDAIRPNNNVTVKQKVQTRVHNSCLEQVEYYRKNPTYSSYADALEKQCKAEETKYIGITTAVPESKVLNTQ